MEVDSTQGLQVVDPEVRAYVYSLVTALGGFGGDDSGQYVLGDDALACLRDLKKWLKFYDEKANRMDVARCLAEANIVNGDLLPILTLWGASSQDNKHRLRIALACLELLVPLTWPLETHSQMTINHHRHTPYLQQAQILYKRGILGDDTTTTLRDIIRIGLPSLAVSRSERTSRDEGILKLVLYLFRNIAIISPSPRLYVEGDDEEASRSATINAFQRQDVFALLLTMCSNMGDDFGFQDVVILEILFHLVKGVDIGKLFSNDTQRSSKRTDELQDLLARESALKREDSKNAPTRHGRFGTMIWVKRDDEKVSTVSGQDVLKDNRTTLLKMDETKKWNKPKRPKGEPKNSINSFEIPTPLTSSATVNLRTFVEEFLDSSFNPLFTHLRKAIEREADRVLDTTCRQFFFVISWFLEAERHRRSRQKEARQQRKDTSQGIEPDSFGLVASVLNQETFILLNRYMQTSYDYKDWQDVDASMRCFTQILLTIQEMAQSPLEEDQEISENIQNRIFYEETTHDRILAILRGYKDQGFSYLNACTELSHVFLRMLERYSKKNIDMQVRSRRHMRRKKDAESCSNLDHIAAGNDSGSDADDMAAVAKISVDRSFDFKRFSAKFCSQKTVNTFVAFTGYYRELNVEQLRRAHRFFYRVAFKQEMSVLLFRVDIISLFYKMIKGPQGLEPTNATYKEWEELTKQIIRKLVKKLEQRPELIIEMLFSKINSTLYYLEFGQEKQTLLSGHGPAAELEVDPSAAATTEEKLGIVVGALILDEKTALVRWLSQTLASAATDRSSWELRTRARQSTSANEVLPTTPNPPSIVVSPPNDVCRTAMFKNAKFRLLMTLVGFEWLGIDEALGTSWIIPSSLSSKTLEEMQNVVDKYCENTIADDSGYDPRDHLRRKRTADSDVGTDRAALGVDPGSDSEGENDINFDGVLFPPNIRSRSVVLDKLKMERRKLRKINDDEVEEDMDEEILENRRRARQANTLARQQKIKSDLFVHASDEESDEEADVEFFAREEERRKNQATRVREALAAAKLEECYSNRGGGAQRRKRKGDGSTEDDDGERKRRRSDGISTDSDVESCSSIGDAASPQSRAVSHLAVMRHTPPTSTEDDFGFDFGGQSPSRSFYWTAPPVVLGGATESAKITRLTSDQRDISKEGNDGDEGDEGGLVIRPSRRPRIMAGFIIDSDSE